MTAPGQGPHTHPEEVTKALAQDPTSKFGRYVRVKLLGRGGMAEVWKAWDTELDRWVALKFMMQTEPESTARLIREAKMAARLTHPNVAVVYDAGEIDARCFIAMQYVDGDTLAKAPRDDRRRVVRWVRDACAGVAYGHEMGVIHRDLKPANIMIDRRGHAIVLDFGLARPQSGGMSITMAEHVVGTPAYMAPEIARGGVTPDPRADVYSLGATLYELLADKPPFAGETALEILAHVLMERPKPLAEVRPGIDRDLTAIVDKALAMAAAQRHRNAGELTEALDAWLAKGAPIASESRPASAAIPSVQPGIASEPTAPTVPLAPNSRRGLRAVVLGGLLLALTAVAAVVWRAQQDDPTPPNPAPAPAPGPTPQPSIPELTPPAGAPALALAATLTGHEGTVASVAVTPDGRFAVSVGGDDRAFVWDLSAGSLARMLPGHEGGATAVLVSPDGSRVVTGGRDGKVRVTDWETGEAAGLLDGYEGWGNSLAWVPGADALLGVDENDIRVWDLETMTRRAMLLHHELPVRGVAATPDGTLGLAASEDWTITVWNLGEQRLVHTMQGHGGPVNAVIVLPDGHRAVTGSRDMTIHIWELETGRTTSVLSGHDGSVQALAAAPNGRYVLSGGKDGTVRLWDLDARTEVARGIAHQGEVNSVAIRPDGAGAVSGGDDKTVRVWTFTPALAP